MSFHVGQTFGDYAVTAVVGAGSMGRVYKVEHSLTKRTEAMKVLSAELASDVQIKRFEREMRALSKLSHPNIAALHNAVHTDNQLILLMEYITGHTLEQMFQAGRLPLGEGINYIKQVLGALGYAHQQGVVHRDISPSNVMVMPDGQVKLTDFGLSKSYGDSLLTNCGEVLGSLPYMAPEQIKGTTQPDRRSDLYSVGAMLYEHLTGKKAFAGRKLAAVLTDSEGEPKPPSEIEPALPRDWDRIVQRALARNPAHRYHTADEFVEAMAQLERPMLPELPLPHLGKLGIGVALFALPVLAVIAVSAVNRVGVAPPAAVRWPQPHIAPPQFALRKSDRKPAMMVRRERAKSTAKPVVTTASHLVSDPLPAEQEKEQPSADSAPAAANVVPAKKGFWNRLNVFHKKHSEPDKTP